MRWTLTLNENGTFLYNFYRKVKGGIPSEENFYGKGSWSIEGKVISFVTNPITDVDKKYTINFTNSKARYITKSPRDKSGRTVETSIRFYQSDLFYIKHLHLLKK